MATIILKDLARVTSIPYESNNDAHSGPAYASFGDEGLTATANAHGHLLQITRYFGNEPSGFYCVDLPETPPPNLIALRLNKLESFYQNHNVGMQLAFENPEHCKDWIVDKKISPMMSFLDDRWPLFITETPAFDLSIQYTILKKTIYQEYLFELKVKRQVESIPDIPNILIDTNLLIRNLNFTESNAENNRGDPDSEDPKIEKTCYETHHNSGIIRKHVSLQTGIPGNDTVGLVIMPFINGEHCNNIQVKSRNCYRISPENAVLQHLREHGNMVVTIAYTLELMASANSPATPNDGSEATQRLPQAHDDFPTANEVMQANFEIISFTEESHLNFILRRNLEHILSVCSIPIGNPSETGIVPIALTCGDISNHRIMAGASFYAFEFLLLALAHLKNACPCDPKGEPCQVYKCRMRYRIRRTCHGHLIWLYQKALQNTLSSSHYWASGKAIRTANIPEESMMDILENAITDIPFHIIKAADFCQIITDKQIRTEFVNEYKRIFERWITSLHLNNKDNEHVFPRSKVTTTHEFHFAEQAIIWRAFKSGETFGVEPLEIRDGKSKTIYSAVDIQTSILQKFSCESSASDKPMIAVSRSVYGNIFRLNFEDTAIFNAVDHGILTTSEGSDIGQSKMELWMNTVDYQMESDGGINTSWNDLLQAALDMMISAKSKRMNSEWMKRRHKSAKYAILRSSSPNGLLTGQSSEDQGPFFLRDSSEYHSYWDAAFKLPYALWKYGVNSPHADRSLSERSSNGELTLQTPVKEPKLAIYSYTSSSPSYYGEKQITNYAEKEKIVRYPNKWLYTKPRFLTFQIDLRQEATETFINKNKSKNLGIVINKAFEMIQKLPTTSVSSKASFEKSSKGYIVDVPQFARSIKSEVFLPNYIYSATNLRLQIDPRVRLQFAEHDSTRLKVDPLPTPAQKRLMHFHEMNFEFAIACYQASSEAESLSRFFDRHATYDKYFCEDAQLIFNSWTTELHLSFYQILSGDSAVPRGIISHPKTVRFPSFRSGNEPQSINKVSMSLRFVGDIFDSSWICHFIEFNPRQMQGKSAKQFFIGTNISNVAENDLWQERRVLELLLFDKMLDEIVQSSNHFLEQIKRSIWESSKRRIGKFGINQQENTIDYDMHMLLAEHEVFDKTPADVFLAIRSAWHQVQRITDIVEEDLKENMDTIDLWMNREGKRLHQPQWTESSDQRYGWTISQLLTEHNRKFDELKRCYDSIKVFNASLTKRMEVASSKWEIQSSDDIRLFTYVTVVFLPISFATGVFSMSGAPSENILRHMIIVAAVALGATIIALFNAKALDSKLVRPIFKVCRYILKRFFDLLYHIVVLPCIYLVARYIYYPAFPPAESSNKTSITQEEAATDSTGLANFAEKARILFHKFDNPISLARESFEKAKSHREETKKKTSMA